WGQRGLEEQDDKEGRERAWFIDLVGVRLDDAPSFAIRVRDLSRLNASFHDRGDVTRSARLRFLRAYLGHDFARWPTWKVWWKEMAGVTAAKVAKNRRTGRPLA